eukprot:CAMPEP_0185516646 /NCGR_PEP_ID=MMETSP1366-20130426/66238_1 /TAXON_ID=38817 /ORGANISM="Gephyrocapsa oceanica, Strain RCC1303" /LENGTH=159 /DNA_ID=CAMNT_0028127563 /DNA_START=89 /DNA_END=565 /DNA_ORIENTATION=+
MMRASLGERPLDEDGPCCPAQRQTPQHFLILASILAILSAVKMGDMTSTLTFASCGFLFFSLAIATSKLDSLQEVTHFWKFVILCWTPYRVLFVLINPGWLHQKLAEFAADALDPHFVGVILVYLAGGLVHGSMPRSLRWRLDTLALATIFDMVRCSLR